MRRCWWPRASCCSRSPRCSRPGAARGGSRSVSPRRCGAAVEIHRAVFRPGDPDLAGGGSETAALADLAMALSRRPRRACDVCAGHPVERRSPLGVLYQADGPRADRGFQAGLHRRTDPDPDRVRDAAGVHPRRDGAPRVVSAARRRAAGARAGQHDVLDHRRLFRLALAARPRRGELVRAGLSGVCDRGRRMPPIWCNGKAARSAPSISACAGRRRPAL